MKRQTIKEQARWWGRMALITWSIFFLFWAALLALAWWSTHR